jgi:hypothetical protein
MKKNVLKAMSVGLSAVTIASTLSVPVYADEPAPVAEPAPAASEQQEIPEAGKPAPTNLDEKAAAKLANELNDEYNIDPEDTDKETLDKIDDLENAASAENFPDGSHYYDEPVLIPRWPFIGSKEVTYEGETEKITNAAEEAGKKIECAADDLSTNVQAATDMDTEKGKAETAVTNAETATSEAAAAVNTAELAVATAVESVNTKSTPQASIDVRKANSAVDDAKKALEDKKADYDEAKADYDVAKAAYEAAAQGYRDSRNHAAIDLSIAEQKLNEARTRVAFMEAAVKKAQAEYAQSAAGQLYAYNEFSEKTDGTPWEAFGDSENVRAIIQYYILEEKGAKLSTVKYIDNRDATKGDAEFEVTYFENGRFISERYGFEFKDDGTVDIYNTDVKYEYDSVALISGTSTTIQKTKAEMEKMVQDGGAVKRYEYRDWYGVHYLTEDELVNIYHQNPKNYNYSYVVVLNSGNNFEAPWDKMDADEEYDYEVYRHGFFDRAGNYHEVIKNKTTKTLVKLVNGEVAYEGTFEDAPGENTVKAKAAFELQGELDKEIEKIKKGENENVDIDPTRIVDVEIVSVQNDEIAIVWTVEGKYVPLYKDKNDCWCSYPDSKKHDDEVTLEKETNVYSQEQLDALKRTLKANWEKEHPGEIYYDISLYGDPIYYWGHPTYYGEKPIGYKITGASIKVVNSYDVDNTKEFETRKEALDSVLNDAKENHVGCKSRIVDVEQRLYGYYDRYGNFHEVYPWVGGYGIGWYNVVVGQEVVYDDEIVGFGEGTSYHANASYDVTSDYTAKVTYTKDDSQTVFQNYATETVAKIYRKTISLLDNSAFAKRLKEIQLQTQSYKDLIAEAEEAKAALNKAKADVDAIQKQLWTLDKSKEELPTIKDWEDRLKLAKIQYEEAEKTYQKVKEDAEKVSEQLRQRIARENQGGGEEERNYVYNPNVIPTIASIPAVTLPDAGVPLAVATRRVRRVAGVEEVEATEETVEETTPEETTEVTVTETEENPVVIDDEDVARAGGTQRSFFARTWWAWLLLVIAAIGGAVAYTKKKATDLK